MAIASWKTDVLIEWTMGYHLKTFYLRKEALPNANNALGYFKKSLTMCNR